MAISRRMFWQAIGGGLAVPVIEQAAPAREARTLMCLSPSCPSCMCLFDYVAPFRDLIDAVHQGTATVADLTAARTAEYSVACLYCSWAGRVRYFKET